MLVELVVENYAVVERVRVSFHPGLNLLTGETGSGKSIVVDALALLFGGRASADMVRSGADRARISGIFQAPAAAPALALLEAAGDTADEVVLRRRMSEKNCELWLTRQAVQRDGRTFAFLTFIIH